MLSHQKSVTAMFPAAHHVMSWTILICESSSSNDAQLLRALRTRGGCFIARWAFSWEFLISYIQGAEEIRVAAEMISDSNQ